MSTPRTLTLSFPVRADIEDAKRKLASLHELGKPNLSLLVVVTAVIGYVLAMNASGLEGGGSWLRAVMLVVGTGLTAMGACAANMCREAAIDAQMERTKRRPIPSGRVDDSEAFAYAIGSSMVGFAFLYVFCGPIPALLGASTIAVYAFVYTPSKLKGPISVWIGAIPGAVPPLMGWSTVTGSLELGAFCMFALLFTWQFPHFLSLAYMYREDYARGGFRFLPDDDVERKTGCAIGWGTVAVVVSSMTPSILGLTGAVYSILAALGGLYLGRASYQAARGLNKRTARGAFLASILYLPLLLVAIVLDLVAAALL